MVVTPRELCTVAVVWGARNEQHPFQRRIQAEFLDLYEFVRSSIGMMAGMEDVEARFNDLAEQVSSFNPGLIQQLQQQGSGGDSVSPDEVGRDNCVGI